MAINPIHLEEFLKELELVYQRNQMVVKICNGNLVVDAGDDTYIWDNLEQLRKNTTIFTEED